jgi:uncharacterized membrane protein YfcA
MTDFTWIDLLLCASAFAAGALNSVAGGGTFLTFPALVYAGLPPVAAAAVSTVAVLPGYLGGALGFRAEIGAMDRRFLLQVGAVSLAGGLLGARLLLFTPGTVFLQIVPWLLLFATCLFALAPRLTAAVKTGGASRWRLPVLAAVAVYGGYFNGGLGILLMAALAMAGVGSLNAVNGLKNAISLVLTVIAVITFAAAGAVEWRPALLMTAFSAAGGYAGAAAARAMPAGFVRGFVVAVGIGMSGVFFLRAGG